MQSVVPPSKKILVVDDEPGLRKMLEILFRREGFEVVAAPGCRSAVESIQQSPQPFPVVLTDLAMPDGSGLDVLAAAKKRSASTEVPCSNVPVSATPKRSAANSASAGRASRS